MLAVRNELFFTPSAVAVMSLEFFARRFDTRDVVRVTVDGERVSRVTPAGSSLPPQPSIPFVAPGFVDVQVNGWGGQEFSSLDLTPEKVARITRDHYPFGVTGYCPTLTTQSIECLTHGLGTIHRACEELPDVERLVAGIHLEGPYFSTEDGPRGAHPKEHCKRPNWDVGSSRVDLQACKLEYSIVSPK